MSKVEYTAKGAVFSECGTYRYLLYRHWKKLRAPGDSVTFIGLNPSTADGETDDPTIVRCVNFAHRLGVHGMIMLNLYAFKATKPKDLVVAGFPNGPDNDRHLAMASLSRHVIAAWGTNAVQGHAMDACERVGGLIECLDITKNGFPKHPLYVKADEPLKPYWMSIETWLEMKKRQDHGT